MSLVVVWSLGEKYGADGGFLSRRNRDGFLWYNFESWDATGGQSDGQIRAEFPIRLLFLWQLVLLLLLEVSEVFAIDDRFQFAVVESVEPEELDFGVTLRDGVHGAFR